MAKKLNFKKDFIYNPVPAVAQGKVKLYRPEEGESSGNPRFLHLTIDDLVCTVIGLSGLSRVFRVHSAGMITVLVIYQYYKLHGYGCGVWDVIQKCGLGDGHCTLIQGRLGLFVKKGLVEVVGTGINNRKLYMPTNYTIKLIDEFIK